MLLAASGCAADTDVTVGSVPTQRGITLQDNERGVVGGPLRLGGGVPETGLSGL